MVLLHPVLTLQARRSARAMGRTPHGEPVDERELTKAGGRFDGVSEAVGHEGPEGAWSPVIDHASGRRPS